MEDEECAILVSRKASSVATKLLVPRTGALILARIIYSGWMLGRGSCVVPPVQLLYANLQRALIIGLHCMYDTGGIGTLPVVLVLYRTR